MLSKTIKYSTSIMIDNKKKKVTVFEILNNRIFEFVLHTWSLIGLWIWLRALAHAQSHAHHLPTRPRSGMQSLDFRKGLERPWPSPCWAGNTTVHQVGDSAGPSCSPPIQAPSKSGHLQVNHLQFGVAAHGKRKFTLPPKLDLPLHLFILFQVLQII